MGKLYKILVGILVSIVLVARVDAAETKAKRIRIIDSGGYYTGTEVEAALQEVGDGTTLDGRYLKLDTSNDPLTGILDHGEFNIINVGDISLDTISSDGNSIILGQGDENTYTQTGGVDHVFELGTNAADDFIVDNISANVVGLVVEGDTNEVGIGRLNPITRLHVDASDKAHDAPEGIAIFQDNGDRQTVIGGQGLFRRDSNTDAAQIQINYLGYNGGATRFRDLRIYDGKTSEFVRFDGSARSVGIGDTTPDARLEILSDTDPQQIWSHTDNVDDLRLYVDSNGDATFTPSGGDMDIVGNLGIGTATPSMRLHIEKNDTNIFKGVNTGTSGPGAGAGLSFFSDDGAALVSGDRFGFITLGGAEDGSNTLDNSVAIVGFAGANWGAGDNPGEIAFETTPDGSTTRVEVMRIDMDGNVGIGNASPASLLDIGGGTVTTIDGTGDLLVKDDVEIDGDLFVEGDQLFIGSGSGFPFGGISVQDNSSLTSVSSAGFTQFVFFDTNSPDNAGVTSDQANEQITVTKAGIYKVTCCFVVENNAGSGHVVEVEIQANDGMKTFSGLHQHRTLSSGTDKGAISICGIVTLAVDDDIELWASSDSGAAKNITISDVSMSLVMVGGN